MLFTITRTTDFLVSDGKNPHARAFRKQTISSFGILTNNPKEIKEYVWCIEIRKLQDLLDLAKEAGSNLIISLGKEGKNDGLPSIEIYNDYRE